ncbi:Nitronate monooxygenase [Tolypocladium ophioglossoides CBS 100239]|uniref:Nitronate monooxygenase n=1 Tax=Tolypocladium ophioglossoides (strain CBS 100239) TaxID=1163406 RepID=A0A0L0N6K3_TOLOC|nr:Nitronate monooxygenase [Tolypocladium ophioglossoides CBS 100239]
MSASHLQTWFPWVLSPVICNGPMIGAACPALAAEVTKAGGIGFISSVFNVNKDSPQLSKLDADLAESKALLGSGSGSGVPLRIGVSFITGHGSIGLFAETALPIIARHRPAAVWLFAPAEDSAVRPHGAIVRALKALDGPTPRVFVQVGNVAAAREAVADQADVLVCQGIDAGGHQFRRGMGVVSFVPEVREMLDEEFGGREVGLLAAGGIVNEKGVAAMMALGEYYQAWRSFTVADESVYPGHRKRLVLKTVDGGSSTLKSPFNDELNNNGLWGPLYDGRAITGPIHDRFLAGSSLEECQRSLKEDYSPEESTMIVNTWAGTVVGLVRRSLPAGEIVK